MNAPPKRKLNAKQIAADIRAGMDRSDLKSKYGLTEKGIESVYEKLISLGLVHESEIGRPRPPDRLQERPTAPRDTDMPWRCPLCGAGFPRRFEECPKCGAVAAKVAPLPLTGYGIERARPQLQPRRQPESEAGRQWAPVVVTVVALVVVGIAIVSWAAYRSRAVSDGEIADSTYSGAAVRKFTVDNFEREVVEASKSSPVLVAFYADW